MDLGHGSGRAFFFVPTWDERGALLSANSNPRPAKIAKGHATCQLLL